MESYREGLLIEFILKIKENPRKIIKKIFLLMLERMR